MVTSTTQLAVYYQEACECMARLPYWVSIKQRTEALKTAGSDILNAN
jgi:hypothetical protein